MKVNLNVKGISKTGPEMQLLGPQIQGNILRSHGRGHTASIFLVFADGMQAAVKQFIAKLPVTSAAEQAKQKKEDGLIFTGLYLSQAGYKYLDMPDAATPERFRSARQGSMRDADLADPPVSQWDAGFKQVPHAMILLAWGNSTGDISNQMVRGPLNQKAQGIIDDATAQGLLDHAFVQHGDGIKRKGTEDDIEHFGYLDGISQPKFFIEDQTPATHWNTMMPLKLVLTDDPAGHDENAFGSYLVFRKLEQNVKGFKKMEAELANDLGLQPADEERAGAMVIGRFEDGTPVTHQQGDGLAMAGTFNDFNHAADGAAAKCPYHAHIRKTNPRGETVPQGTPADTEKAHTMARRGIIYGKRNGHPNDEPIEEMPEGEVGLLFMSFQSDLANQFEFIQRSWANDERFLSGFLGKGNAGLDPTIGRGSFTPGLQRYAGVWGDATSIKPSSAAINFQSFVTLKGGEYFFAPSMSFLKSLATHSD